MTAAERREIRELARRPDSEIDLTEIPELDERFWRNAVRGAGPVAKRLLTVRLDEDVLDWLRGMGKGYQTKLNAMLRAAMRANSKAS